jgi:hypothetical protein
MINYWLDQIDIKKEIIEKLNQLLQEEANKEEEKEWELDV